MSEVSSLFQKDVFSVFGGSDSCVQPLHLGENGGIEDALPKVLTQTACHELYALQEADAAATTGLGLALSYQAAQSKPLLWVRHSLINGEVGFPHAQGLRELGLDPAQLTLVSAPDARSVLQAGLESVRCAALGAVLIELWGETRLLDLTASRRLSLAAKTSKTAIFFIRVAAAPQPSAAETRWQVRALSSDALAAGAPGFSTFDLMLLRRRNGQAGQRYHVEWNRNARTFITRTPARSGACTTKGSFAPVSRLVVPFSLDRSDPPGFAQQEFRQAG